MTNLGHSGLPQHMLVCIWIKLYMSYSSPRSGWISRIGLVRAAWATWCIRLPHSGSFWAKPVAVCSSRASFSKHILHETPTWRKALSSASETVGQRSPEASRSCPCTKRKWDIKSLGVNETTHGLACVLVAVRSASYLLPFSTSKGTNSVHVSCIIFPSQQDLYLHPSPFHIPWRCAGCFEMPPTLCQPLHMQEWLWLVFPPPMSSDAVWLQALTA